MKKLGFLLALGLAATACGDDDNKTKQDATVADTNQPGDVIQDGTVPDGPNPTANFTSYVIDLVKNHTNGTDAPRPFSEFSNLADPDATNNNTAAYASLFM